MEIERAIKILDTKHPEHYDPIEMLEARRIGMKALEKQIPKMVTHEATLEICCTCPSCGNVVDSFEEFVSGRKVRITYQCCHFCGQRLKWSEDD